jgi:hypothetical protein
MSDLLALVEAHQYQELFIHELNWGAPDHKPVTHETEAGPLTANNVSTHKGIRVWVCERRPGSKAEAELDRVIAKTSTDRIVIFYEGHDQVWRWPVRRNNDNSVTLRLTRHHHRTGKANSKFTDRLEAIRLPADKVLDANSVLTRVRAAFDVETRNETRHASQLMARMYEALESAYPKSLSDKSRDHQISVTLARILFLMFGDDTEMWSTDAFRNFVRHDTKSDGSDLGKKLTGLFEHLNTPPAKVKVADYNGFVYVNGGIFEEALKLPKTGQDFRDAILDACAVDWSTVSPAIFGSMFQSVRDARTRRELGEHYTSEENILKTLDPLFLDRLRRDLAQALTRDTAKKQENALRALWARIGDIRFMDPACGCGNFIIVAYRQLRELELQIMEALQGLSGTEQRLIDPTLDLKVRLDHFFGIEIDEWPARIAETAMFLIDRQCDLRLRERFGEAPDRLPIKTQSSIVVGSALATAWEDVCPPSESVVIAGNPPFLGISLRSAAQTEELQSAWGARYHGTLDYVTGWHAKALSYFKGKKGRWAFVTTNSITQGEVVAPLFEVILDDGWHIDFAHRTFPWTSEAAGAAAVHCVIIGFTRDDGDRRLFDYPDPAGPPVERDGVANITPYLTDGETVIVRPSTRPLNLQLGEVAYGNKPTDGGWLVVEPDDYADVVADDVAAKYVRRYVGARELLHDGVRHCLWLLNAPASDIRSSKVLRTRVKGVREFREDSKAASTREAAATPHLFRQISQPKSSYLCIPQHVSETREYFTASRFAADVISSNANFLTPDEDGFTFSIVSSAMFIAWQRAVGGRIKSDLRFNKLLVWNTFPLPPITDAQRSSIIDAGRQVVDARALNPQTSLADQYAPGSLTPELREAHEVLDRRVDALFDLPLEGCTELQRQTALFDGYRKLTGGSRLV